MVKVSPTPGEYQLKTDDFTGAGLPLWPQDPKSQEAPTFDKQKSQLDEFLDNASMGVDDPTQTNKETTSVDEHPNLSHFEDGFIQKVRQNVFMDFCEGNVVKVKARSQQPIVKTMTFQKDPIPEPLLDCKNQAKVGRLIFRSLLKVSGNRRTRFPHVFHAENLLSVCFGNGAKLSGDFIHSLMSMVDEEAKSGNTADLIKNHYSTNIFAKRAVPEAKDVFAENIRKMQDDPLMLIRDEMMLQTCKQIKGNPDMDSTSRMFK